MVNFENEITIVDHSLLITFHLKFRLHDECKYYSQIDSIGNNFQNYSTIKKIYLLIHMEVTSVAILLYSTAEQNHKIWWSQPETSTNHSLDYYEDCIAKSILRKRYFLPINKYHIHLKTHSKYSLWKFEWLVSWDI